MGVAVKLDYNGPPWLKNNPIARDEPAAEEEKTMSLWEHINELRKRLFVALIAFILACVATFNLTPSFITILAGPVGGVDKLLSIEVTENLGVFMRVSLLSGFILSLPILLYELMAFVAPGLTGKEKRSGSTSSSPLPR